MAERFGSRPEDLRVAIGPAICQACYQVGEEVVARVLSAGLPAELAAPDDEGRWRLDLTTANVQVLTRAGVPARQVFLTQAACTSCDRGRFYSHRRDRGVTGRHWGAIRATTPAG
jgi:copper oxidase (laccase) domain-containing protein